MFSATKGAENFLCILRWLLMKKTLHGRKMILAWTRCRRHTHIHNLIKSQWLHPRAAILYCTVFFLTPSRKERDGFCFIVVFFSIARGRLYYSGKYTCRVEIKVFCGLTMRWYVFVMANANWSLKLDEVCSRYTRGNKESVCYEWQVAIPGLTVFFVLIYYHECVGDFEESFWRTCSFFRCILSTVINSPSTASASTKFCTNSRVDYFQTGNKIGQWPRSHQLCWPTSIFLVTAKTAHHFFSENGKLFITHTHVCCVCDTHNT